MAVLTDNDLTPLRRLSEKRRNAAGVPIDYTKGVYNAAMQAIEDWFEANKASLAAAIPGPFIAAEKKQMVADFIEQKARRERA